MLAYLFWHRPEAGAAREEYERAQERFHRSLAQRPPDGFRASLGLRVSQITWLSGEDPGYEDWYVVDDWTALGVLRQAAVGQAHHRAHERAAAHSSQGAGAVYRLLDGRLRTLAGSTAVWVQPGRGQDTDDMAAMLLDGARAGTLWQRELVLGPAPEYCLLAEEPPPGVAAGRLPPDWRSHTAAREALWATDDL